MLLAEHTCPSRRMDSCAAPWGRRGHCFGQEHESSPRSLLMPGHFEFHSKSSHPRYCTCAQCTNPDSKLAAQREAGQVPLEMLERIRNSPRGVPPTSPRPRTQPHIHRSRSRGRASSGIATFFWFLVGSILLSGFLILVSGQSLDLPVVIDNAGDMVDDVRQGLVGESGECNLDAAMRYLASLETSQKENQVSQGQDRHLLKC